jgi:hypothetical protein
MRYRFTGLFAVLFVGLIAPDASGGRHTTER